MKLKKSINKTFSDKNIKRKFQNCNYKKLNRGDYLRMRVVGLNQKRKGGFNFRVYDKIVLLLKKKRKKKFINFHCSFSL